MKRTLLFLLLAGMVSAAPSADKASTPKKESAKTHQRAALQSSNGIFSLHEAAVAGDTDVIAARLAEGFDVNELDEQGNTPLILAAVAGHRAAVKALLAGGADVCRPDKSGKTPMDLATKSGVKKVLAVALDKRRLEIELSAKIEAGNAAAVKEALAAGVNPEAFAADPTKGNLLALAVTCKKTDIAQLLMAAGAKAQTVLPDGRGMLHVAVDAGAAELIPLLLKAGADPMHQVKNGATALHNAAWTSRVDCVRALLPAYKSCGFCPDGKNQPSPLAMASARGAALQMAFIDGGADPNKVALKEGETFLFLCVQRNASPEVIKALMARGGDPTIKAANGKCALDVASPALRPLLKK
ncbi:MAG: ankyrin repeat domain-containing protein [Akkermansia sp.]